MARSSAAAPSRQSVDPARRSLKGLEGLIPYSQHDRLSGLLSDTDLATLRHLVTTGIGVNTLRALTSDLAYLERWSLAATGEALPWPAGRDLILKFIAHHLWDPVRRESDPNHGMPEDVQAALRREGALRTNARMPPARSSAVWPSGAPCTSGEAPRGHSATARCGQHCASPVAPRPAHLPAKANEP